MNRSERTTDRGDLCGTLVCRLQPGARRAGLVGWLDGMPKIAVTARAVDGAANKAAIVVVAEILAVKPRTVRLVTGHTARTKRFVVTGLSDAEIQRRLAEATGDS